MTDPHAPAKLASLATADECDGWIAQARADGDDQKARSGLARKLHLMKGRK